MKTYKPNTTRLKQVDAFIKELFDRKLPKGLYYHNANHTLHPLEGVVSITEFLSEKEGIPISERELLATAAYFHDTGYIERYCDNEIIGAKIAAETLHIFQYSQQEIEIIKSLILATKIPAQPKNHLESIICDADVDNLGREDFFEKNELLMRELGITNKISWYKNSINFLEIHKFYTKTAQELGTLIKGRNLVGLRDLLAKEVKECY